MVDLVHQKPIYNMKATWMDQITCKEFFSVLVRSSGLRKVTLFLKFSLTKQHGKKRKELPDRLGLWEDHARWVFKEGSLLQVSDLRTNLMLQELLINSNIILPRKILLVSSSDISTLVSYRYCVNMMLTVNHYVSILLYSNRKVKKSFNCSISFTTHETNNLHHPWGRVDNHEPVL